MGAILPTVNPLTKEHIKADGKLAQKLLKMHQDKQVKLKRGDIKIIKECKQHGGVINDCPLNADTLSEILPLLDIRTAARCSLVFKDYTTYCTLLSNIAKLPTLPIPDMLNTIKHHFGYVKITAYKEEINSIEVRGKSHLFNLIRKLRNISYSDDEFFKKEEDFLVFGKHIGEKSTYPRSELYKQNKITLTSFRENTHYGSDLHKMGESTFFDDNFESLKSVDDFNKFKEEFENDWNLAILLDVLENPDLLEYMLKDLYRQHNKYNATEYDDDHIFDVQIKNNLTVSKLKLTLNAKMTTLMEKVIAIIIADKPNKYDQITISELIDFLMNINIIHKIHGGRIH